MGYRLLNLLAFYKATVGQLAGLESPLMESLSECRKNADDTFRNAMKREVGVRAFKTCYGASRGVACPDSIDYPRSFLGFNQGVLLAFRKTTP